MTMSSRLYSVILQVLLALYSYVLIRIILFKFHPIDMSVLWDRMKYSLGSPDLIIWRLKEGNLVPFKEISRSAYELSSHDLINLFGNIVVFMPFGILLSLLSVSFRISARGAFVMSFGLSLCLEGAQVLCMIGQFDVDDLILNSCGGLIGFVLFRALRQCVIPLFRGGKK